MVRPDGRGVFLALAAFVIVCPWLAAAFVALAVLLQACLGALNLFAGLGRADGQQKAGARAAVPEVRFSVHVATHDEPPALVERTVRALAAQEDAPEFEVIVLDNNTADARMWRPIEALCAELGPCFRFYHEEGVEGAKAGALNIALGRTDPQASHVVIVDADYGVEPDFLNIAAREIRLGGEDFVQFPQAYRNDSGPAAGLSLELADYFLRHARQADVAGAMLLTGTLSVIRRDALEAAGGWSGRTITEDAELGLRLRQLGHRGRFVDRVVGRGLLPLDLAGLTLQRYRWVAGNVGTIRGGLRGLPFRTAVQVFSQLTAWANMALPFAAGLVGGGAALMLGVDPAAVDVVTGLSGIGLALVYLSVCLPMVLAALVRGRPPARIVLAALASRITMILPSAVGTVDALLDRSGSFRRTAKDAADASDAVGATLPLMAACGVAILAGAPHMQPAAVLGAVLMILPYPLALGTRARLSAYRASLQSAQELCQ